VKAALHLRRRYVRSAGQVSARRAAETEFRSTNRRLENSSFGVVAFGATAAFMLLRSHARRASHNELHRAIHSRVLRRTWLFLAIYAASIPLAFVEPWLSLLCFATVAAMLFVPVVGAQRVRESMTDDHQKLERSCP
jgi:hypothetical protein